MIVRFEVTVNDEACETDVIWLLPEEIEKHPFFAYDSVDKITWFCLT